MSDTQNNFSHPYDTATSATLRFSTELIAWIAGPWLISSYSIVLATLFAITIIALPAIFSALNDKRMVVIAVSGKVRIIIEALLYTIALICPWIVWSNEIALSASLIVIASLVTGAPRLLWLYQGRNQS